MGSHPIVGDVIGFALTWDGQEHGAVWISGDTVLYRGVREVAGRIGIGTAILHLGAVRFPISGPVKYTMDIRDAAELCELLRPRIMIPVHYEGWSHFREGRAPVERYLATASPAFSDAVRWSTPGEPMKLTV